MEGENVTGYRLGISYTCKLPSRTSQLLQRCGRVLAFRKKNSLFDPQLVHRVFL